MARILVVDDETSMIEFLEYMLRKDGHVVTGCLEAAEALERMTKGAPFDLIISDIRMPGVDGLEFLRSARSIDPDTPFIFITAHASSETAIEALKLGAFDYVTKPFEVDKFRNLISNAITARNLKRKVRLLESELPQGSELIGTSAPMLDIYKLIGTISATDSTVIICGESGTGKEMVARAIHKAGPRRDCPFVSINCGAFPETLLESELFGYMKGAFTGAVTNKKGLFETAAGGTLFLDEVGEMSPAMQVKLLRALQDKRIRRVGGTEEIPFDARVIAATNRDIRKEIEAGRFREDLYYRLAVIPITIPPLRERRADILPLVRHFMHKCNLKLNRTIKGITEDALECLERYHWPGNVRELENVIERAATLATTGFIQKRQLPEHVQCGSGGRQGSIPVFNAEEGLDLESYLREMEKQIIEQALFLVNGNQTRAAEILKLSYRSLRHRLESLQCKLPNSPRQ
ncbi:MAG TPA: sigma-54 dependent transcriptional regulator [Acidobacteriota bacterium]|nr:sigma-54 dependent transcriptional regulator [Acidobacteriota bacterium]